MKRKEFLKLINNAGFTKESLALDLDRDITTINNWGLSNKKVPKEVIKYLECVIKLKIFNAVGFFKSIRGSFCVNIGKLSDKEFIKYSNNVLKDWQIRQNSLKRITDSSVRINSNINFSTDISDYGFKDILKSQETMDLLNTTINTLEDLYISLPEDDKIKII